MLCLFASFEVVLDINVVVDHELGVEENEFMVLVLDHDAISLDEFQLILHGSVDLAHDVLELEEIDDLVLVYLDFISGRT